MRKLFSPTYGLLEGVTPVKRGGTDSKTAQKAVEVFNILTKDKLGVPNGVATLVNGLIPPEQLPENIKPAVHLLGQKEIGINIPTSFQISNYDVNSSYIIEADVGLNIVIGVDGVLTLTASGEQLYSFTINDSNFQVTGVPIKPNKPLVLTPVTGAQNQLASVSFITGSFSLVGGDDSIDTHASSVWELATDVLFVNKTHISNSGNSNLTNWKVNGLSENTTYYLRVAHVGAITGQGFWSDIVSFTTKKSFVPSELQQEVFGPTASGEDYFGWSVDLASDGNTMLVGAYNSNYSSGNVYEYQRSGSLWGQPQPLPIPVSTSFFGYSVSISEDANTAVVGSPENDTVHCYSKVNGAWQYRQQLVGQDTISGDKFGLSVCVSGDGNTIAVGSRNHNNGQGAVYIYLRGNDVWAFQQKLVPSNISDSEYFGASVSLSYNGDVCACGAYGKNLAIGSVRIWARTQGVWGQQQEFSSNDPISGSHFGYSVSLSSNGTVCLVGAPNKNNLVGAAYVYIYSAGLWSQQQKLVRSTNGTAETDRGRFGSSVSLDNSGTIAVVGADAKSSYAGAAYVFSKVGTSWSQKHKLTAPNGASQNWFGSSVSISADGGTCAVGAWLKDATRVDQGSVYVFV